MLASGQMVSARTSKGKRLLSVAFTLHKNLQHRFRHATVATFPSHQPNEDRMLGRRAIRSNKKLGYSLYEHAGRLLRVVHEPSEVL